MINLIRQGGDTVTYLEEYIIDTTKDVERLPTSCRPGSSAFCLENGAVYMLGGDKKWKEV